MQIKVWVGTFDPFFYQGRGWVQSGQGREGFYLWTEVHITSEEQKEMEDTFRVPDSVRKRLGIRPEDWRNVTR